MVDVVARLELTDHRLQRIGGEVGDPREAQVALEVLDVLVEDDLVAIDDRPSCGTDRGDPERPRRLCDPIRGGEVLLREPEAHRSDLASPAVCRQEIAVEPRGFGQAVQVVALLEGDHHLVGALGRKPDESREP